MVEHTDRSICHKGIVAAGYVDEHRREETIPGRCAWPTTFPYLTDGFKLVIVVGFGYFSLAYTEMIATKTESLFLPGVAGWWIC
jgi:hypothetical protein